MDRCVLWAEKYGKCSLKQPTPCSTDCNNFCYKQSCFNKLRIVVAMPWVMGRQIAARGSHATHQPIRRSAVKFLSYEYRVFHDFRA